MQCCLVNMLRSLNKLFLSDFFVKSQYRVYLDTRLILQISKLRNHLIRQYSDKTNFNIKVLPLSHRSLIKLSGTDSIEFLQGLLTNDVYKLPDKKCMYAMILNSKGRVMHDIIMYYLEKEENTILLECQAESLNTVWNTLKLYKLRKNVEIIPEENIKLWQVLVHRPFFYPTQIEPKDFDEYFSPPLFRETVDSLNNEDMIMIASDPRLSWLGWRILSANQPCSDDYIGEEEIYHNFRYFFGIPEGPIDLVPGKSLPLESNVDFMNGISFDKGCYLGQELTARSHFTGMIRKRLVPVVIHISKASLEANDNLFDSKGSRAGKFIATADGKHGLALINLSRQSVLFSNLKGVQLNANKTFWWPTLKYNY